MISESVDSTMMSPPIPSKTKATSNKTANAKSSSSTSSSSLVKNKGNINNGKHEKNQKSKLERKAVSNNTNNNANNKKDEKIKKNIAEKSVLSTDKSQVKSSKVTKSQDNQANKKKKKKRFEEMIIDGFAITAFKTWEDLQDEINERISLNNEQSKLHKITAEETKCSLSQDIGHVQSSSLIASTSSGSSSSSSSSPIKSEQRELNTIAADTREYINKVRKREQSDDEDEDIYQNVSISKRSKVSNRDSFEKVYEAKERAEKRLSILQEKLEHERNKTRNTIDQNINAMANHSTNSSMRDSNHRNQSHRHSSGGQQNGSLTNDQIAAHIQQFKETTFAPSDQPYIPVNQMDKSISGPKQAAQTMQGNALPPQPSFNHMPSQAKQRNSSPPPQTSSIGHNQNSGRRQNFTSPPLSDFIPNLFHQHQTQHQMHQQAAAAAAAAASDPNMLHNHYLSNLGYHHQQAQQQHHHQHQNQPYNPYGLSGIPPPPPHMQSIHSFPSPYMTNAPPPPPAASTSSLMRGLPAPYGSYIITDTTISRQTSIIPPPPPHAVSHLGLPPAFAPSIMPPPVPASRLTPQIHNQDMSGRFLPPPGAMLSQSMQQHKSTYTPSATERSFMEFARNYANASHSLMNHHHASSSSAPPVPPPPVPQQPPQPPTLNPTAATAAASAAAAAATSSASNPFAFDRWSRLAMEHQRAMSRLGGYFPGPNPEDRLINFPGYPGATRPLSFPVGLYPPPF